VQPHNTLRLNAHHSKISYNVQMNPYLHRLGLYQIAIMGDCQLDKSLLIVLVKKWRPETSTFHLSVGEMTVTLENVYCPWGFPIRDILNFLKYYFIFYFWNIKNTKKNNNMGDWQWMERNAEDAPWVGCQSIQLWWHHW
jgi:Plant mobile domain